MMKGTIVEHDGVQNNMVGISIANNNINLYDPEEDQDENEPFEVQSDEEEDLMFEMDAGDGEEEDDINNKWKIQDMEEEEDEEEDDDEDDDNGPFEMESLTQTPGSSAYPGDSHSRMLKMIPELYINPANQSQETFQTMETGSRSNFDDVGIIHEHSETDDGLFVVDSPTQTHDNKLNASLITRYAFTLILSVLV